MSEDLGNIIPDALYNALIHEDVTFSPGKAILITTSDSSGWPHPALLSFSEVGVKDRNTIRIKTYSGSNTTQNLKDNGVITIVFIDPTMTYYVKGLATILQSQAEDALDMLTAMNISIRQVLRDFTSEDEEGAFITSGIMFHNPWDSERRI